jgi:DNA-binding LytR/AlgR family response regulator
VINAAHVRTICRDLSGRALIRLVSGEAIPVGRRYTGTIDALTR